jgi:carbon-monoxide dehydrogenase medium subunit
MIPHAFEYERPETVADAIGLLAGSGDGARVLAGGHSLLPMMKLRLASPGMLVDIGQSCAASARRLTGSPSAR